jgi:hypothetical protein
MKPLVAKTSQLLHQQAMVVGAVETKRKEIGLMRNRVRSGVKKKKKKRKKNNNQGESGAMAISECETIQPKMK